MTMKLTLTRLLGALALVSAVSLPGAPALADDGKAALRLMPEDTAMVLTANIDRIKKSPLAQKLLKTAIQRGDVGKALDELRAKAGLDIERDIRTLSMGMPGDFEKSERFWMIVEGRFDKAKITAVARKEASFKRLKHQGVDYAQVDKDTEMAFLGRYLVVTTKGAMPAIIDAHRGKTRTAAQNAALMALIKKGDTSRDMWGAFVIPSEMRKDIAKETQGHSIDAVMATLDIRTGVAMKLHMDTSSSTAASAIATMMRAGRDQIAKQPEMEAMGLGSALKSMKVETKDARLGLSLDISAADLEKLGQLLPAP
jgi:hypothetical protein